MFESQPSAGTVSCSRAAVYHLVVSQDVLAHFQKHAGGFVAVVAAHVCCFFGHKNFRRRRHLHHRNFPVVPRQGLLDNVVCFETEKLILHLAPLVAGLENKLVNIDGGEIGLALQFVLPVLPMFGTRVNAGDFKINRRLYLGLQLGGGGRHDATNITGMLNINVNTMFVRWSDMQDTMAKATIKIGKELLEENLQIECKLSPLENGQHALHVASDSRWDKRGSGHCYDSLSGLSIFMGLRAQLPIEVEPMSSA
jgi:hypothetical protein